MGTMGKTNSGDGMEVSESEASRDRRLHRRRNCCGTAELLVIGKGLRFSGRILDVSESGCFIETEHQLERGTHLEVTFEVDKMRLRVAGGIRAVRMRSGIGIQFTDMTPRRKDLIQHLLDHLEDANPSSEATS